MMRQTERLRIREISETDLYKVHALNSFPEVDKYNTIGNPATIEDTRVHLLRWLEEMKDPGRKRYVFCIEEPADGFIGLIGITLGKPNYRNAEMWYKLIPDQWNRGYATEAVLNMMAFCFDDLKLHRLEAGCATGNTGSIRVLEKCGFHRESHARKLLPIRGDWFDNYGYAMLETDYKKNEDPLIG